MEKKKVSHFQNTQYLSQKKQQNNKEHTKQNTKTKKIQKQKIPHFISAYRKELALTVDSHEVQGELNVNPGPHAQEHLLVDLLAFFGESDRAERPKSKFRTVVSDLREEVSIACTCAPALVLLGLRNQALLVST